MKNALPVVALITLTAFAPKVALAQGPAAPHPSDLTLGVIQRSIKAGMSSTEVVDSVGSPNLVTRGRNGRESWVYDRFATETSDQGFQAGGSGIGGAGNFLGVFGLSGGKKKTTTSQRTLLLVVTFGPDGMVESFNYRSSKF